MKHNFPTMSVAAEFATRCTASVPTGQATSFDRRPRVPLQRFSVARHVRHQRPAKRDDVTETMTAFTMRWLC